MKSAQQFLKNELREPLSDRRPKSRVYEQRYVKEYTQKEINQIRETLVLPISLRSKQLPTEKGQSRYKSNISWNFSEKLAELRKLSSNI
ncbi:hypothetical protein SS50377_25615 [Spironucleus salmonicida]|uniref:Uncharacterized protein n=1 Tax=Spironucleus salmonicida TaxID=348837 RepID=V6M7N5_9EUKA|nr:hypothetical protein SS50377_25615 [Spironucleus salmonicida]|eukprot:EST49484.1 Hypothetical protein SS50377_10233 [Spironucleus salmonicida]